MAYTSPRRLHTGVPLEPTVTNTTPPTEAIVHHASQLVIRSPNSGPATIKIRAGCRAWMTRTSATLVALSAMKNSVTFSPKMTPPGIDARTIVHVRRRPVAPSTSNITMAPDHSR